MKDFAKSIRTNNEKVGNEDYTDLIRAAKKRLEDAKKFGWAETGYNGWTEKDVEDLEKKIKELEQKQKTGNSKVGNLDPRISSFKTKLENLAKQGDEGAIKDVERFVEDMIKELSKKKEELYKQINRIEEDRQGYLDLRGDVMSARYEATHLKK